MTKDVVVLRVCAKTVDGFTSTLMINDKQFGETYDGYVPKFFPEEHFGDYIELDIDINTGQILNWKKPTLTEVKKIH